MSIQSAIPCSLLTVDFLIVLYGLNTRFTKEFLKAVETGAQKWYQRCSKSGPKTGTPLGSPAARKCSKFKWFLSVFDLSEGSNSGFICGTFRAQFRDYRISKHLSNLINSIGQCIILLKSIFYLGLGFVGNLYFSGRIVK